MVRGDSEGAGGIGEVGWGRRGKGGGNVQLPNCFSETSRLQNAWVPGTGE